MKKLTLVVALCVAIVSTAFGQITLPYTQAFDSITEGTLVSSSSSNAAIDSVAVSKLAGIQAATTCYKAGSVIRLGKSSSGGTITTDTITTTADSITVFFDALCWASGKSTVILSYGSQTDTIAIAINSNSWPLDSTMFVHYGAAFAAEANKVLTITSAKGSGGDNRVFLDNLNIIAGDSISADTTVVIPQYTEVANIAAFIAAGNGTSKIIGTVTVTAQTGKNLFITDSTGNLLIHGQLDSTYNNGDQLTGIIGAYAVYSDAPQLIPEEMPVAVAGPAVDPAVVTITGIDSMDFHKFVKLENMEFTDSVTYTTSAIANGTATDGTNNITIRNNYKVIDTICAPGKKYDIVGIVGFYNKVAQIYPLSITERTATGVERVELLNVYTNGNDIFVPSNEGDRIVVISANGAVLYNTVAASEVTVINNMERGQMLIIVAGNKVAKVVL